MCTVLITLAKVQEHKLGLLWFIHARGKKVKANCWAAGSWRAITLQRGEQRDINPSKSPSLSRAFQSLSYTHPALPLFLCTASVFTRVWGIYCCVWEVTEAHHRAGCCEGWCWEGWDQSQCHAGGYRDCWELGTGQKRASFGTAFPLLVRAWEVLVTITGCGQGHPSKSAPCLRAGWVQVKGWSWLGQGWGWTSCIGGPKDAPPGGKTLRTYTRKHVRRKHPP